MSKTVIIGLCGRSGTGKGYVAGKFLAYGIPSVDTDAVYREMTSPADHLSPCMKELVTAFGRNIALPDRSLNRRALSETVFAKGNREALTTLNRITHKHILEETRRIIDRYRSDDTTAVIVDAPLLFESGFDAHCDCTVCVTAPTEVSVQRIVARDGITENAAHQRLRTQIAQEELIRRCDYQIENGLNEKTLDEQVEAVVHDILSRFHGSEEQLDIEL